MGKVRGLGPLGGGLRFAAKLKEGVIDDGVELRNHRAAGVLLLWRQSDSLLSSLFWFLPIVVLSTGKSFY